MSHAAMTGSRTSAVALLAAVVLLTSCGGSDGPTPPAQPPAGSAGSLTVTIAGLPGDVTPSVTVTGPAGYTQTFAATRTLTGLTPGAYTITSANIADRSIGYAAPVASATVTANATASASASYALRILARTTTNRTDESTLPRFKLLYLIPNDGTDRGLDTNGTIHRTISSGQRWLASQTAGRAIRYDVADGGLDITFVRLPRTDAVYFSYNAFVRDSIEKDLRAAGWTQSNVLLLGYYEGRNSSSCASAAWPPNYPGTFGGIYLRGLPNATNPCANNQFAATPTAAPGYLEYSAQHEIFHLLGVVSTAAPNHALAGHVGNDPTDLMYAGPLAWRPSTVDVTKTNYYNPTGLPGTVTNFTNSPYVVAAP
jgi:hypothetical protein